MINFPALSIQETLVRVAAFNDLVGFGLASEDFERLAATAPAWPSRAGHLRTLRLRKNGGTPRAEAIAPDIFRHAYAKDYPHLSCEKVADLMDSSYEDGVHTVYRIPDEGRGNAKALFDRHVKMISATLGDRFADHLSTSNIDYAPAYGPGINRPDRAEWIMLDLFARPEGTETEDLIANDWIGFYRRACADELLAALWLHPEAFMRAAEALGDNARWWATGYETSRDVPWGPAWSRMGLHFAPKMNRFLLTENGHGFIPEIVLS